MKPINIDEPIRILDGLYTDLDPEDLPVNYLSYGVNTQWINKNIVGKRNGYTKVDWLGTGYLKAHDASNTITKAEILDYGVFSARRSSQIYHIAIIRELTPMADTGWMYIEIRNSSNDTLVSSHLLKYDDAAGGQTKNATPTRAKLEQQKDLIFLADGSEEKLFYLDLSTPSNISWSKIDIKSSTNTGFYDNDPIVDVAAHLTKVFCLGEKGKAYYNKGLSDQTNFTTSNGGFVEYNAQNTLIAKDLEASTLGLLILSENKGLNLYGADLMTGTQPPSNTPATDTRGYDVMNLSNDVSYIPGSTVNVDNNIYGLTKSGVVDLLTFSRNGAINYYGSVDRNLQLEETLSYPIDDLIRERDFASENVYGCYNPQYRRYYLSIPKVGRNTTKEVFVYDYKYKVDVPRWSYWRLKLNGIRGMFSTLGKSYVADLDGELYELESGITDNGEEFTARIETAAIGGETIGYEKQWSSVMVNLKVEAEDKIKNFNIFAVSDEYLEVVNNYGEVIKGAELQPVQKFPSTFDSKYYFDRTRTFDDEGYGQEVTFIKNNPYRSKTIRLVIEERIGDDGLSAGPWTFKSAFVRGYLDSEARQRT